MGPGKSKYHSFIRHRNHLRIRRSTQLSWPLFESRYSPFYSILFDVLKRLLRQLDKWTHVTFFWSIFKQDATHPSFAFISIFLRILFTILPSPYIHNIHQAYLPIPPCPPPVFPTSNFENLEAKGHICVCLYLSNPRLEKHRRKSFVNDLKNIIGPVCPQTVNIGF